MSLLYHPPFLARVSIRLTEHHCSDVAQTAILSSQNKMLNNCLYLLFYKTFHILSIKLYRLKCRKIATNEMMIHDMTINYLIQHQYE